MIFASNFPYYGCLNVTLTLDDELVKNYGIHFSDGMIVAAAERGKCKRIFSENLAHGQEYFGVRVENPFL